MSLFKRVLVSGDWAVVALALASTCTAGVLGKATATALGQYIVEFVDGSSANAVSCELSPYL